MATAEPILIWNFRRRISPPPQAFFKSAFGWTFVDYGPDYTAFSGGGMEGGFYKSERRARSAEGSALVIFYSEDLAATQARVEAAGGDILQPIFEFPGGRRFHFAEPSGNEFAGLSRINRRVSDTGTPLDKPSPKGLDQEAKS